VCAQITRDLFAIAKFLLYPPLIRPIRFTVSPMNC